MSLSLIAAIGKNRELGKNGGLVFRLPSDLKFFKEVTMGHPIVMGRKTFESLPKMLPGRRHYVVTSKANQLNRLSSSTFKGARPSLWPNESGLAGSSQLFVVSDLGEFLREAKKSKEEYFVIGGGKLYKEAYRDCDKLYITEVDAEAPDADTFFPEVDFSNYQRKVLKKGKENGLDFAHVLYIKNN